AKLITHGKDRNEAIQRMVRAIDDYHITGCETTLPFCKWAIQHEAFVSGNFDTHFVKKYFTPEVLQHESDDEMEMAALAAASHHLVKLHQSSADTDAVTKTSRWKTIRMN
ncbi:MAG: biotin carboxylase, partial [Flavobacteriales bacterium]